MGNNSTSTNPSALRNFPIQKYVNQGMSQQQVIKIK